MLIASALLSLSVMSAFVAFNGFPGQNVQAPIGSLLLGEQHPQTVTVPTKPVRSHAAASASHAGARTAAHRASGHARAVKSPLAHANPVGTRTPSGQAPTQAPASSVPATPQQSTVPVSSGTVSDPLSGSGGPALPTTSVPALPPISLPSLGSSSSPPPENSQVPIDTSGVTSLLGGQ